MKAMGANDFKNLGTHSIENVDTPVAPFSKYLNFPTGTKAREDI
jgi:hypothetical protein